ncbi:hypothetical protein B0H19DRAFT_1067334 [Mycena capillaripes]|nr:hypothetical protein B0H19DRAFT_1067334 [Mycena capillaripes]
MSETFSTPEKLFLTKFAESCVSEKHCCDPNFDDVVAVLEFNTNLNIPKGAKPANWVRVSTAALRRKLSAQQKVSWLRGKKVSDFFTADFLGQGFFLELFLGFSSNFVSDNLKFLDTVFGLLRPWKALRRGWVEEKWWVSEDLFLDNTDTINDAMVARKKRCGGVMPVSWLLVELAFNHPVHKYYY